MTEVQEEIVWLDWPNNRPEGKALCWWRVAPRMIGEIEWRPEWVDETHFVGMGYSANEWWPPMSNWDGYKRTLPKGLQWRLAREDERKALVIPVDVAPCPICGSAPHWEVSGSWATAAPHLATQFTIGHCFARLQYFTDLPKMLARWNKRDLASGLPAAIEARDKALERVKALEEIVALEVAMTKAAQDVCLERSHQQTREGWTYEHDDEHLLGEMAAAAACYALYGNASTHQHNVGPNLTKDIWPWSAEWWKPKDDKRKNLVRAGALIIAEIERLDRAALRSHP